MGGFDKLDPYAKEFLRTHCTVQPEKYVQVDTLIHAFGDFVTPRLTEDEIRALRKECSTGNIYDLLVYNIKTIGPCSTRGQSKYMNELFLPNKAYESIIMPTLIVGVGLDKWPVIENNTQYTFLMC